MDRNKMNLKNSPKLIPKKSSKREKNSKNTQETRTRAITDQEHGLGQVARAHAPCIGIWTPSSWAPCNVLGVCPVHLHPMHPNGCTPMQGVRLAGVGHTPPHSPHGHTPYSPRGHGLSHRVQCVWVQVALSNPLSPLRGSRTLHEPNTRQRIFSGPHTGLSVFYIDQICIILSRIQLKIS